MLNLREKAIKGVGWSAIGKWTEQGISFLLFLLLANLLEPEDFGLVAIAFVFITFIKVFLDQGMVAALIQRDVLEKEHLDTAFWTNLVIGGIFTISGVLLSGLVALFFDEPRLNSVVAWLSISFFIFSLSTTQEAILRRRMDFKGLAIRSVVAKISGGVVGVILAFSGFGVWSLVAQNLVRGLIAVVVLWRISGWRPRFRFSKKHFKELFSFGINVLGTRILSFFDTRIDILIIGYFMGSAQLGYYIIGLRVVNEIIQFLTGFSGHVIFVTFSKLQKELNQLRTVFYQLTQFMSLIAWPIFLGLALFASELVTVLFGAKWLPSIPIMQILAFSGFGACILYFNGTIAIALGKPSWDLAIKIVSTIVRAIAFTLAARWSIIAIAIAFVLITYVLVAPLNVWLVYRFLQLDLKKYFGYIAAPLLGSAIMVAFVIGLRYLLSDFIGVNWQLIIYALSGALVYFMVIFLTRVEILRQLLNFSKLIILRRKRD